MKNNLLIYYIAALYFGSTFVVFAEDPGAQDENGTLENIDPVPINDYVWVLLLAGLILVFLTFRAIQNKKIQN